ncbi:MAG: penicillin-binding protein activator [Gammaproteobacteria bacterium]|nr:penicillin-binding protein activator [Gammaproteobacteria bacterium]
MQERDGPRNPADSPRITAAEIALSNDDLSAATTLLRMAAKEFRGARSDDLMLEAEIFASELAQVPVSSTSPAYVQLQTLANRLNGRLPTRLQGRYWESVAAAQRERGQARQALRSQWKAFEAARSPQQRLRAEARLWQDLQKIPTDQLIQSESQTWPVGLSAWRTLALAVKPKSLMLSGATEGIDEWRAKGDTDGVSDLLITRIQAMHRYAHAPVKQIALLLPLSGDLSGPGRRIQTGFLAAYYSIDALQRPENIRFIDIGTSGLAPAAGYREAVTGGADIVLGPLSKDAVASVLNGAEITVPLLALNRIDQTPPGSSANTFQFGLAPEDEAAATAATALALGYQRIVILAGNDDWSQRVTDAFVAALNDGEGTALEIQRYPSDQDDLSIPVRGILNLDEADQRTERLESLLGIRLKTEPKRRSDAEALFIAARPGAARVLIPQIRFHDGLDLPVLAPASAVPGSGENVERDFEGVVFAEMPWLMPDDMPPSAAAAYNQLIREREADQIGRLEALGVDAFHLAKLIHILKQQPGLDYPGASGLLHISEKGFIKRRLAPVEVRTGSLHRLLDTQGRPLDYFP